MESTITREKPENRFELSRLSSELQSSYRYCREVTVSHYENFPVASILLPHHMRWHVYAIYAFARHADDLADEHRDYEGLLAWRKMLHKSLAGDSEHPIFIALANTIETCKLPVQLFDDLLSAFEQDLQKNRYESWPALLDYCRRSANPVGRLILLLNGYRDAALSGYSDAICTALQLTNFWQDVSVDLQKNRIYLPQDVLSTFGIDDKRLFSGKTDPAIEMCIEALCRRTRKLFAQGLPLLSRVGFRLRLELTMTVRGGLAILDKIEKMNYQVLATRPKLNRLDWIKLLFTNNVEKIT